METTTMKYNVLRIDASSNPGPSTSGKLADSFVAQLAQLHVQHEVVQRDLNSDLTAIDGEWIGAAYTPDADRSDAQQQRLALSDELIAELQAADEVVIAVPMYNFSVPSELKVWIDLIARAGKTFEYTAEGPRGLVADKPVTLIVSTGGVPIDSPMDFLTPYLRQVLGFVGISDVSVIPADGMNTNPEETLVRANSALDNLFQQRSQAA
jgi:FMN-dependent NADH-azoreductase